MKAWHTAKANTEVGLFEISLWFSGIPPAVFRYPPGGYQWLQPLTGVISNNREGIVFSKQTMRVCGYNPIGCPSPLPRFSATPYPPVGVGVGCVLPEAPCLLWWGVLPLMPQNIHNIHRQLIAYYTVLYRNICIMF